MNGWVEYPILGRMISADPLLGDLTDPQSLNRYSYVRNNPLALTDPSGFDAQEDDKRNNYGRVNPTLTTILVNVTYARVESGHWVTSVNGGPEVIGEAYSNIVDIFTRTLDVSWDSELGDIDVGGRWNDGSAAWQALADALTTRAVPIQETREGDALVASAGGAERHTSPAEQQNGQRNIKEGAAIVAYLLSSGRWQPSGMDRVHLTGIVQDPRGITATSDGKYGHIGGASQWTYVGRPGEPGNAVGRIVMFADGYGSVGASVNTIAHELGHGTLTVLDPFARQHEWQANSYGSAAEGLYFQLFSP
jgi:hypothetical protein